MAESDDAGGLFCIAISDDEAEPSREDRNAQTEETFQALKASYTAKLENGEIWKEVELPATGNASKPQAQLLLHAIEELYFFRRYEEGARLARKVMEESAGVLDAEHQGLVLLYEEKCLKKSKPAEGGS